MNINASVDRLNVYLPLKERQAQLSPALKAAHQAVLFSLVNEGRPPTEDELKTILGALNINASLQRLGADDLIVLDTEGKYPVGAYPVTIEKTPHRIIVKDNTIYAMCALDALSIAPIFDTEVVIQSMCHVSQTSIVISMQGDRVLDAKPSNNIMVGIRWQSPSSVAAHSLCMEMIFLKDRKVASMWQNNDKANISLFTLSDAVEFGKAFFLPLL